MVCIGVQLLSIEGETNLYIIIVLRGGYTACYINEIERVQRNI